MSYICYVCFGCMSLKIIERVHGAIVSDLEWSQLVLIVVGGGVFETDARDARLGDDVYFLIATYPKSHELRSLIHPFTRNPLRLQLQLDDLETR